MRFSGHRAGRPAAAAAARGRYRLPVVLCASSISLLLWGAPAQAAVNHGFSASFGAFTSTFGVAVDDSAGASRGDVYVVDQGAAQVDRFTAAQAANDEAGTALTGVSLAGPSAVAVDDSTSLSAGDVYVTEPAEGVVEKFNGATGKYESQIDGSETPNVKARGFEPAGVGVDPANGDLFVTDPHNGVVDIFTATGAYSGQFRSGVLSAPTDVAVNGAGDAYVTTADGEAFELLAEGEYTSVLPLGVGVSAVSVDPVSGDVYLDEGATIAELNANGESLGSFGAGSLGGSAGVGVDSATETVYASSGADADIFVVGETPKEPVTILSPTGVSSSTATLRGTLAGGETGYYFTYGTGTSCAGESSAPSDAAGSVEVSTEVGALAPATQYTACLVATNAFGQTQGSPVTFTTSAVLPSIEGESFSDIGSRSVTLNAQINPHGSPTTYYYEYGPTSAYGSKTAEVSLGGGQSALPVPAQVTDLAGSSEYHFTVVAVNDAGVERGADATFRTLPVGVSGLPDERVYERVSPVSDEDANVYIPQVFGHGLPFSEGIYSERPFEAAANGDAVVYVGDSPSDGSGSSGETLGNDYFAKRSAAGGWQQINLQPTGYYKAEYKAFSSDLSVGIVTAQSEISYEEALPPLSPEAPSKYKVLYAHQDSGDSYQPLFTKSVTFHRPPGFAFEGGFGAFDTGGIVTSEEPPEYTGASADFGELLFEANDALTTNALDGGSRENNLYMSVAGRLSLINVLPDGSTEADATFGAPPEAQERRDNEPDFSRVISTNGSRVFWGTLTPVISNGGSVAGESPKALYMREDPLSSDARTVQVDAAVGGGGRFWTATANGSRVFFTKGELYEYDVENGLTTNLTPGIEVKGVVGASENGEYVYFGNDNNELELWHDGVLTPIAVLAESDGGMAGRGSSKNIGPYSSYSGPRGDWTPGLGTRTAEVTPDGRSVVFMSSQSLKAVGYPAGYRNEGMVEVYVYEAQGGQLFCASCNPTGEPPESNQETAAGAENDGPAAAFLPISYSSTYMRRWISEDGGRVFFDSAEPLVSQDTNGKQDVYEWERDGEGSCREAAGCIYLLSGGTSSSASWLLDASASGDDVFMITRAGLVPGDPYDSFAVYDARVGGVQPLVPPACTGSGCQGVPPTPPIFATPASVTFTGVGNFPAPANTAVAVKGRPKLKPLTRAQKLARALKACRGKPKRRRTVCEARAHKRYATAPKTKKSAKGGR
jgi:hypothetical protein